MEYPAGLAEEAIPLAAPIIHIACVFDALTFARSYRSGEADHGALALMRLGFDSLPTRGAILEKASCLDRRCIYHLYCSHSLRGINYSRVVKIYVGCHVLNRCILGAGAMRNLTKVAVGCAALLSTATACDNVVPTEAGGSAGAFTVGESAVATAVPHD